MVQKQRFHRRGCERSKTYLERTLADEKIYNIPSAAFHKDRCRVADTLPSETISS
jgi:hypothetical protein